MYRSMKADILALREKGYSLKDAYYEVRRQRKEAYLAKKAKEEKK